jgi:hypothetical protein
VRRSRKHIKISWQPDDQCWLAVDPLRPGCCAVDTNKTKLWCELRHAQDAWDEARRNVDKEIDVMLGDEQTSDRETK